MKREILFRGKRVDNGEWVEGYVIDCDGQLFIYHSNGVRPKGYDYLISGGATIGFYIEVDPETVGQFAGLTDKYLNKVFDNDIVQVGKLCGFVYFDNGTFKWSGDNYPLNYKLHDFIQVIGNIHDNPELLK